MKRFYVLLVFVSLTSLTNAQYFQTGQDPASVKWRQINTENFQIIYPDYYEKQAQKLAAIMEKVYEKGGQTLNYKPGKISIILHTQTVKSNGLVAWAPKRSEFYTIPHQEIYAQDWIEQLAIHEFRHVVQIDKLNSELPKIIKILFGEQGTALVFGAYIPWWFIEGDAVVTETAFSNSGRGRFPSFLMEHKALAVEKGNYKYDKAYNGSFKNYVPDHYQLGYYLVGQSREKYGAELWNSVINRVGSKPFSLSPLNKALKDKTGMNKVQLYNSVFNELKQDWVKEDQNYKPCGYTEVSAPKRIYSNYTFNHFYNDSLIISYKTALNQIPSFVRINSKGTEKKIFAPGSIFEESVNYRGEWIVWSERVPDARWHHSGKSYIRILNIETKHKITLKPEFTAFAPSISPDKNKIVMVETNFSSEHYISVYQISDGKLLSRFQTINNNYFFSPEWLNDKEIVFVVLLPEGKRIAKIDIEKNQFEILYNKNLGEIKNLRVSGNNIYFVSSYSSEKNNLYRFNLNEKLVYQIYESRFGIESPAISDSGKSLILSDYTASGFRIIKLVTNQLAEKEYSEIEKSRYLLAEKLSNQENGKLNFFECDSVNYPSKKYRKISHLLNFHSWAPAAVDASSYEITPGVSVVSQNKLGTAVLNLGYKWEVSEKTGNFYGKYSFKGWYPVFDFEISSGQKASEYTLIQQTKNTSGQVIKQDTIIKRFTWSNTDFGADIRLPLDLSRGKFYRLFQPEIKYGFTKYTHNPSTPERFFKGSFHSITYRSFIQQMLGKSNQDVYPDFGFVVDGLYRHSPFGANNLGNLILGQSYLYLPGLMPNHGIRFYGGVQKKKINTNSISFSDIIRYPRGWGKISTNYMYSFASDYKMPVFYPEWNIGSLIYLQRITTSVFADFACLNANIYKEGKVTGTFNKNITSFGFELSGNCNFLRFYAPVEIGLRTTYLPEKKNFYFNFLFSIDFNSL